MPINRTNSLFIHIPKCGGTSIEVALGVADEYPNIGLEPTFTQPHIDRLFGGDMQHLTIREVRENFPGVLRRRELFSFSVIRDPVDRFVSYFLWKHYRFSKEALIDEFMLESFIDEVQKLIVLSRQLNIFRYPFDGMRWCEGDDQTIPLNDPKRHLLPECSYIFDSGVVLLESIYTIEAMKSVETFLRLRDSLSYPIPKRMVGIASKALRRAIPASAETAILDVYHHDARLNEIVRNLAAENNTEFCPGSSIDIRQFVYDSEKRFRGPSDSLDISSRVPRKIWLYWHQGKKNMGAMVRKCVESWERRNASWDVHLLTAKTLGDFVQIPEFYDRLDLPLAALSDVIRIHLLEKYGGVWADATTWCVRPLDEWLEKALMPSGFFAYEKPAPDRPIASWFLAAYSGHKIVRRLKEATNCMWRLSSESNSSLRMDVSENPLSRDYFWFHKLFGVLLERDSEVAQLWRTVPKISADAPHYLQRVGLTAPATAEVESHIRNKSTNVYKLNRRIELPDQIRGTVIGTLFDTL